MDWSGAFEALLSLSLLGGAAINIVGAIPFLSRPIRAAASLGLPIDLDNAGLTRQTEKSLSILLQLNGVLLVVLACFYAMTAIDPLAQVANVVLAIVARLIGVVYYAYALKFLGAPNSFKRYLALNLFLAVVHGALFSGSPGGWSLLRSEVLSWKWIAYWY